MAQLITLVEDGVPLQKKTKSGVVIAARRECPLMGISFGLYIQKENYSAGRMVKKWFVSKKASSREEAVALFKN